MKFTLTPEQAAVQETTRQILAKEWSTAKVRELRDGRGDQTGIHDVLGRSGLLGLAFPDELGGGDGDLVDLGVLFSEIGRALGPTSVATSIDALMAMQAFGAGHLDWFSRVRDGEALATTALWNPHDADDVRPRLAAERVGDGWRLDGRVSFVRNGGVADVVVVAAETATGASIAGLLRLDSEGVGRVPHTTFAHDDQVDLVLDGAPLADGDVLAGGAPGRGAHVDATLRHLARVSTALQCAEMVGGARVVLERTTDYIRDRKQFGRAIGSFQAAQHHVANMRMAVDAAELVAGHALSKLADGQESVREVAIAKIHAGRSYRFVTQTAHQLHGGIGLARESDLHLWSERAKALDLLGGGVEVSLMRLAGSLRRPARRRRLEPTTPHEGI